MAEKAGDATFNVNDYVFVNLTEAGVQRLLQYFTDLFADTAFRSEVSRSVLSHLQKDGTYRFQMWEAFHIFGPDMFNGSNRLPFASNRITIRPSL